MATKDDVRRVALSLPETDEHPSYGGTASFRVKKKSFTRIREDDESIVVFVEDLEEKDALLRSDPRKFFTTPHYDGYPTVLVRFAEVDVDERRELLNDSWRLKAPKRVLVSFEAEAGAGTE